MSEPTATYEWRQLPWRKLEVTIFKLQKRIYRASQANEVRRVHKLQRLLVKSRAAKYLAVRRVTQDNHGKQTAGGGGGWHHSPHARPTAAGSRAVRHAADGLSCTPGMDSKGRDDRAASALDSHAV